MKARTPPPATTSAQRQRKRRAALNAIADSYGFASWTQLETAIMDGRAAVLLPKHTNNSSVLRNTFIEHAVKRSTPKKIPGATTMDAGNG